MKSTLKDSRIDNTAIGVCVTHHIKEITNPKESLSLHNHDYYQIYYLKHGRLIHHLENGRVVIFGCGLGSPFFSTDTAAALRAAELNADVLLLAKNVDGIYDSDPKTNPNAKKYTEIKYIDFIKQGLKAMDTTAVTICMENNTPILAFGLNEKDAIVRVCEGEELGTWIR